MPSADAPVLVFVYGTLKQGFPNHHLNLGRRIGGTFRTRESFPLYVTRLPNEDRAPWLVHQPGFGHRVSGEVFEIDAETLAALDVFEEVGLPTGYVRVEVALEPLDDPATVLHAHAYMKQEHHLHDGLEKEGPFDEYTLALAAGYQLRAR